MVAGGAESGVSTLALALFNQIHALSRSEDPATASQPFGAARSGFVMSEGACVLVLEDRARAIERGARIYAEVAGTFTIYSLFLCFSVYVADSLSPPQATGSAATPTTSPPRRPMAAAPSSPCTRHSAARAQTPARWATSTRTPPARPWATPPRR
jgi:hypothetical protein